MLQVLNCRLYCEDLLHRYLRVCVFPAANDLMTPPLGPCPWLSPKHFRQDLKSATYPVREERRWCIGDDENVLLAVYCHSCIPF